MSTFKRKRSSASGFGYGLGYSAGGKLRSGPIMPVMVAKKRRYAPGRDRVGGYYGRYAGKNAELKFHDVEADDAIIAAGGVITASINLIAQGTGESERIGRKCTLRSIMWRGSVSLPEAETQGAPGDSERVRLILYLDKQCNGAAATALGILEVVGVDNYRNLANSGRFNILMDKTLTINYQTTSHFAVNSFSNAQVMRPFSFFKKCAIPLEFDNTTGAVTEIRSNNVGLLIVSAGGAGALVSSIRLRFSDQ